MEYSLVLGGSVVFLLHFGGLVVQPGRLRRPVSLANREAVLHIFDVRRPLSLVSLCKVHR